MNISDKIIIQSKLDQIISEVDEIKEVLKDPENKMNECKGSGLLIMAYYPDGVFFTYTRFDLIGIAVWRHLNNATAVCHSGGYSNQNANRVDIIFSGSKEECVKEKFRMINNYSGKVLNIRK